MDAIEECKVSEPELPRAESTLYRTNVMLSVFLAIGRCNIVETVKILVQFMSRPTRSSFEALKRFGRYLKHQPSIALV